MFVIIKKYTCITLSLTVYSPLPPNKPNPTNKMLQSTEKRIASTEWPEYPQPPPKPKKKNIKQLIINYYFLVILNGWCANL